MSNQSSSKNNAIIKASNFEQYENGERVRGELKIKLITSLVDQKLFQAQLISAEPPTTEEQLLNRFDEIISVKYELLTPFIGYTKESPHLLVSTYFEKDILNPVPEDQEEDETAEQENIYLNQIFHKSKGRPIASWLDGTSKTKIALCIAKAMMILHENNIIHQNLQPNTIKIIGESHLPHLIDYGLNEFRGKPHQACPKRYLAPELKKATDYTKETDVFAFGVVLCEILKGRNYYETTIQPPNIQAAPKKLRKLIIQCFSQDPKDRPTFAEIYDQFKNHEAMFEDTNNEELEKVIKALDEIEYRRNNNKFKSLIELNSENTNDLFKLAREVNPSNAENFFNIIGNKFYRDTDYKLFKSLLNITLRFVQDPVYCKIFVNTQVHWNLPFDNERLFKPLFDIVYWIAKYEPKAIYDISDQLVHIMPNPKYTKKILVILTCYQQNACYQKEFVVVQELWKFLDQVLTTIYRSKNLKYQSNFISIYYTLCKNVPIYKKGRLKHCVKIFSNLIDSENNSTIRAVYAFLSEYKDEQIPAENVSKFYDFTAKHLVNPHTALAAVKYLLIKSKFPIKKELVNSAIRLATISHLGNLLLCKIADTEKGSSYLMKKLNFIELALPDLEGTLKVLLILLQKRSNLEAYRESDSLPFLIANLSRDADLRMITIIQNLLFIVKCDNIKFINELEENNFCRDFYDSVQANGDGQTMKNTLNIFKLFAIKCPQLEFFKDLIKNLKKQISNINKRKDASRELLFEILSLFTLLSSHPDWIPLFKDFDVYNEFKDLKQNDPETRGLLDLFKKNIDGYNYREKKIRKRAKSAPKNERRRITT